MPKAFPLEFRRDVVGSLLCACVLHKQGGTYTPMGLYRA